MTSDSQERSLVARRLLVAIATPVVLLIALGVILGRQILEMSEDARWLDHSDQILGIASDTLRQITDQETGTRGYQLTHEQRFLEPFERAHPSDGFARLHELTSDNPTQQARFDEARRLYDDWLTANAPSTKGTNPTNASVETVEEGKARMDRVRVAMAAAVDGEVTLRHSRTEASAASTSTTKIVFTALLLASAVVLGFLSRYQLSSIASTFGAALASEKAAREATEAEAWVRRGHARLVEAMQGDQSLHELGASCLNAIAKYTSADVGAFFTRSGNVWKRHAGFGLDSRVSGPETFDDGEGIVGRVGEDGELLHVREMPSDYLKVRSGTGESSPVELVVVPGKVDGAINTIVELGFLRAPEERAVELLKRIGESLAVAVRSADHRIRLRELLDESQQQAEELQTQQEELRVANEELEAQTQTLRTTQLQLETQQAELEQINENLVQQSHLLETKNQDLAEQRAEIAHKAREVERASRFKSEFLSNMSHELRTPLNSSLILAKLLADNKDENLNAEQVKFAETIYSAGNDLLTLINDILDLSKIEAGKMDVNVGPVPLERMRASLTRTFAPVAKEKGLRFAVTLDASAPIAFETDGQRVEQILKNLASNALKFTAKGEVVIQVTADEDRVVFAVRDTGIGIPPAQQRIIFEAFRQADGTTNRKYGGTGLGLSISRELGRLLGGDITVSSEAGVGSTFTLSLPRVYKGPLALESPDPLEAPPSLAIPTPKTPIAEASVMEAVASDGAALGPRIVLVIEDDPVFADVLISVAREAGFQCVVATTAHRGFELAKKHIPTGIVLDMKLPDHSGLSVLERLKRDPVTRHIPVHVVSASDYTETALSMGAAQYLMKPVERAHLIEAFRSLEARSTHRMRRVLVVDDDLTLRESVAKLLGREDVQISTAESVEGALALLREHTFDCVVTDLGLPDQSGYDLLETMAAGEPYSVPPVIVYTGRALTPAEEQRLRKYSKSIIVKGARSPERLLDEVTLFLHQVESELPADQQRLLKQARHRESVFEGRNILVVEDDVRNVFALTSVLEPKGAHVVIARNGREALTALEKNASIHLVLMDIMMPEMDGLEATRAIRKNPQWQKLPIIALTAKAMQDDLEKCLAAGANDYMAKPLDIEILLSLLRVWMPKA